MLRGRVPGSRRGFKPEGNTGGHSPTLHTRAGDPGPSSLRKETEEAGEPSWARLNMSHMTKGKRVLLKQTTYEIAISSPPASWKVFAGGRRPHICKRFTI